MACSVGRTLIAVQITRQINASSWRSVENTNNAALAGKRIFLILYKLVFNIYDTNIYYIKHFQTHAF